MSSGEGQLLPERSCVVDLVEAAAEFKRRMGDMYDCSFIVGVGEYFEAVEPDSVDEEPHRPLNFRGTLLIGERLAIEPLVPMEDDFDSANPDYLHSHEIAIFNDGRIVYHYSLFVRDSGDVIYDSGRTLTYDEESLPDSIRGLIERLADNLRTIRPEDEIDMTTFKKLAVETIDPCDQAARLGAALAECRQRLGLLGSLDIIRLKAGNNKMIHIELDELATGEAVFVGTFHQLRKVPVVPRGQGLHKGEEATAFLEYTDDLIVSLDGSIIYRHSVETKADELYRSDEISLAPADIPPALSDLIEMIIRKLETATAEDVVRWKS